MFVPQSIAVLTVLFVAACSVTDLRTRRIPNVLSFGAIAAGVLLNCLLRGPLGAVSSLAGLLLTVGVLLGPFSLGGLGGGDVKMMGAVGALLGPAAALSGLAIGVMCGGLIAVAYLVRLGRLREILAATQRMFTGAVLTHSLTPLRIPAVQTVTLPYSVPLGLGTVASLLLFCRMGG